MRNTYQCRRWGRVGEGEDLRKMKMVKEMILQWNTTRMRKKEMHARENKPPIADSKQGDKVIRNRLPRRDVVRWGRPKKLEDGSNGERRWSVAIQTHMQSFRWKMKPSGREINKRRREEKDEVPTEMEWKEDWSMEWPFKKKSFPGSCMQIHLLWWHLVKGLFGLEMGRDGSGFRLVWVQTSCLKHENRWKWHVLCNAPKMHKVWKYTH